MVMPYIPDEREQDLLDAYANAMAKPVIGFDGIAEPHLQALKAVESMVAERTRKAVVAELGAADAEALAKVAEAASALLFCADNAIRASGRSLRKEADAIAAVLHARLDAAGYTARSQFTGHHEVPGQRLSIRDLIDEGAALAAPEAAVYRATAHGTYNREMSQEHHVSMQPGPQRYFVASYAHGLCGGCVMWFRPDACGYTPDIKQAGSFTKEEAAPYVSDQVVAVPVEWLHQNARIRMVVDAGDEHASPKLFWSAEQLRAAIQTER